MARLYVLFILVLGVFSVDSFGIIGGERANGSYPQVVSLGIYKDSKLVSLCSGSIVGKKTILTAAHCLVNSRLDILETDARRIEIDLGHGRDFIFAYAIPSEFRIKKKELDTALAKGSQASAEDKRNLLLMTAKSDLALIYTREIIPYSLGPLSLGPFKPEGRESVEIAGFGEVEENGIIFYPNELFLGRNRIFSIKNGTIILRMGGEGAITSTGDSGGPLLNEHQQIIGVLSGGGPFAGTRESFYLEIFNWLDWIQARIR
jgi:hypothetical protein